MKSIGSKTFLGAVLVGIIVLAACAAPAAAPTQTPASPPASTAPSTAPAASPSAPAKSAAPAASPSAYDKAMEGWDQVVAAAKKEGKVTLYATPSEDNKARVDAFEKANPGIKVELVGLRGSQARDKVAIEINTGQGIGDVSLAGQTSTVEMADRGGFTPWFAPAALKPGVSWIEDPYGQRFRPKGDAVALSAYTSTGVLINTEKVPPAKVPKTWTDLLDPFYKDRTTMQPLNQSAGVELFNFIVKRKLDVDAFVKGVNALNPFYSQTQDEQIRLVITADKYAFWPVNNSSVISYLVRGDLPIKYIAPGPRVLGTSLGLGLIKTAPHPNAGKVLINWLLTEEGQAAQAKAGASTIMKGLPAAHPALDLGSDVYKGVEIYWQSPEDVGTSAAASKEATQLFGLQ